MDAVEVAEVSAAANLAFSKAADVQRWSTETIQRGKAMVSSLIQPFLAKQRSDTVAHCVSLLRVLHVALENSKRVAAEEAAVALWSPDPDAESLGLFLLEQARIQAEIAAQQQTLADLQLSLGVLFLCGLPGTGKVTLGTAILAAHNPEHILEVSSSSWIRTVFQRACEANRYDPESPALLDLSSKFSVLYCSELHRDFDVTREQWEAISAGDPVTLTITGPLPLYVQRALRKSACNDQAELHVNHNKPSRSTAKATFRLPRGILIVGNELPAFMTESDLGVAQPLFFLRRL